MGQALSKLGGTKRLKQLEEWKSSSWSFSIDIKEVNRQLVSSKRELEEQKAENSRGSSSKCWSSYSRQH